MLSLKLPRLFSINQVPKVFHEDSIIFGYRHPRSSAADCVLSLFQMTNETVNIWTHFLPTWYFLWNLLALSYTLDFWNESYTWPLLVFMLSSCIYPFTSSCAHTFSSMSTRARHICFFFDYGALSIYSLGSAIVYGAYVMPEKWIDGSFHGYFVPMAVFNTVVSTALSCYSRLGFPFVRYNHEVMERFPELDQPKLCKLLRVLAFAYPYLFDNIPLFYRLFLCSGSGCTHNETLSLHYQHVTLAFLTSFLYATHLPERLAPGCFDYIGHSHQLFHICAIIGTYFQMEAILADMRSRHAWLTAQATLPSFMGTLGAVSMALSINLIIIALFSLALYWPNHSPKMKRQQAFERENQD
ncbi:membrane progestin receptor gamma-B isoform X2 [Callorhinchus milii]|uniref:membrane progestin receptor gamma-B isoform X2 n=1 Tax=Callorhinchus milii TaxID=7868 RepID=UPI00045717E4|nr:membrane progestin receptor gamma-B isoform X2 [Callorhinchus milii]|eukprot:gi/632984797/ref/XP_007909324.1/ PREDICTED: membrane progestin receptor gamma isoform X1 [Callorhinchus milii]